MGQGGGRLGEFSASPAVEFPSKERSPGVTVVSRGRFRVPRRGREAVRNRVVPVLAVLLWIGASGAGRGAETIADPSAGRDALSPKEVRTSCNIIAAILTVYPTFVVGTSEGPVRGVRGGPESAGCRVRAAGPAGGWSERSRQTGPYGI